MQKYLRYIVLFCLIVTIIVFVHQYRKEKSAVTLTQQIAEKAREEAENIIQKNDEEIDSLKEDLAEDASINYNNNQDTSFLDLEEEASYFIDNANNKTKKKKYQGKTFQFADGYEGPQAITLDINMAKNKDELYIDLIEAIFDSDKPKVIELLNAGISVNGLDRATQYTPLFSAISKGDTDIVSILLERGASTATPDDQGFYPIHRVITKEDFALSKKYPTKKMLELLIDNSKANINRKTKVEGRTPLMVAIYSNNEEAFKLLLEYGADPTIKNAKDEDVEEILKNINCAMCIYYLSQHQEGHPNQEYKHFPEEPDFLPKAIEVNKKKETGNTIKII